MRRGTSHLDRKRCVDQTWCIKSEWETRSPALWDFLFNSMATHAYTQIHNPYLLSKSLADRGSSAWNHSLINDNAFRIPVSVVCVIVWNVSHDCRSWQHRLRALLGGQFRKNTNTDKYSFSAVPFAERANRPYTIGDHRPWFMPKLRPSTAMPLSGVRVCRTLSSSPRVCYSHNLKQYTYRKRLSETVGGTVWTKRYSVEVVLCLSNLWRSPAVSSPTQPFPAISSWSRSPRPCRPSPASFSLVSRLVSDGRNFSARCPTLFWKVSKIVLRIVTCSKRLVRPKKRSFLKKKLLVDKHQNELLNTRNLHYLTCWIQPKGSQGLIPNSTVKTHCWKKCQDQFLNTRNLHYRGCWIHLRESQGLIPQSFSKRSVLCFTYRDVVTCCERWIFVPDLNKCAVPDFMLPGFDFRVNL